jgi:SulP family sulfate permease
LGVEQSILLAIVMSLVVQIRGMATGQTICLLIKDKTQGWRLQPVSAPEQAMPGLMIYRFMHNIYYANIQVLTEEVVELTRNANPPLTWFCIDVTAVNDVDFTAAETLRTLQGILVGEGVRLVFCEVIEEVQVEFDRSKLTDLFGRDAFFRTLTDVTNAYRKRETGGIADT